MGMNREGKIANMEIVNLQYELQYKFRYEW